MTGFDGSVAADGDSARLREIAMRMRSLREDLEISIEDMAAATNKSVEVYTALESGSEDFSFTTLYHAANRLGVDMIDLLTGEGPHLSGYSIMRAGDGLSIKRRAGFEYLHLAPTFKNKLAEPFMVTAPYNADEQDRPIHLSRHEGQEMDYIVSGQLKFAYQDAIEVRHEILGPGDTLFYDSGRGHGMIATGGEPCTFLAIVLKPANTTG
ncbi:MAG: cupin domain-containing protein [Actinomycetes bacterium]|jgi:transcriptional regulator with XRE-family HTH domain|nr:cupin domain-containing protein [Actinomycetes bacterium]